jgi:hypothetical protein
VISVVRIPQAQLKVALTLGQQLVVGTESQDGVHTNKAERARQRPVHRLMGRHAPPRVQTQRMGRYDGVFVAKEGRKGDNYFPQIIVTAQLQQTIYERIVLHTLTTQPYLIVVLEHEFDGS